MKLAIDGYEANTQIRVGIGRYAYEMLCHLHSRTKNHDVTVFLPSPPRPDMPPETHWWRYSIIGPKNLWTFIGLPLALMRDSYDVVFSPTHYIPRFTSVPRVMAIMDVSYLKYPELFRSGDRYKLIHWTRYSVFHARKIMTISQFSKNAIIRAYNVPDDQVIVAYPGFDMGKQKNVQNSIGRRYILSVGTLQPRKNFERLIEAFSTLADKEILLVIVGKKGWLYEEILKTPKKFGVASRVRFMDFVHDDQLNSLYRYAEFFVLPSLYEGFGLPVLEAMVNKTRVVVSNTSSLPEIAGDAGIYVNPESVESITEGLTIALHENEQEKKHRIAQGLARVQLFTWDKAASEVMKVLESTYASTH